MKNTPHEEEQYNEAKRLVTQRFLDAGCPAVLQDNVVHFILQQPEPEREPLITLAQSLYQRGTNPDFTNEYVDLSKTSEEDRTQRRLLVKLLSSRSMKSIMHTIDGHLSKIYQKYPEQARLILAEKGAKASLQKTQKGALAQLNDLTLSQKRRLEQLHGELSQMGRGIQKVSDDALKRTQGKLTAQLSSYSSSSHHKSKSRVRQAKDIEQTLMGMPKSWNYMAVLEGLHTHKLACIEDDLRKNTKRSLFKMNRKGSSRLYHTLNDMHNSISNDLLNTADPQQIHAYRVFCRREFKDLATLLSQHCRAEKKKEYQQLIATLDTITDPKHQLTSEDLGLLSDELKGTKLPGHLKAVSKELEERGAALIKDMQDTPELPRKQVRFS